MCNRKSYRSAVARTREGFILRSMNSSHLSTSSGTCLSIDAPRERQIGPSEPPGIEWKMGKRKEEANSTGREWIPAYPFSSSNGRADRVTGRTDDRVRSGRAELERRELQSGRRIVIEDLRWRVKRANHYTGRAFSIQMNGLGFDHCAVRNWIIRGGGVPEIDRFTNPVRSAQTGFRR